MPVRSLNSFVLVWPDRAQVERAAREWAAAVARDRRGVRRIGYFGSYANGTWGVGSDLDLVAVVDAVTEPFARRAVTWPLEELPVPAEMLIFTPAEFERLRARGDRFASILSREVIWIWPGGGIEDNLAKG